MPRVGTLSKSLTNRRLATPSSIDASSLDEWLIGLVDSMLRLSVERLWVQILPNAGFFKIFAPSAPLASSAVVSMLTVQCQWEEETVRERTGHQPSYEAEAKSH